MASLSPPQEDPPQPAPPKLLAPVRTSEAATPAGPTYAAGVYGRLRRQLVEGTIPPGTRLVEEDVASQLGVSRTPVREALRRLQSDGFVQQVRRRGLIVTPMGPDDIGDIGQLRVEIDGVAARLAVARATPRDWDSVLALVERLGQVPTADADALSVAHMEVHRAIYGLGFSPRMAAFFENHMLPYLELSVNPGAGKPSPSSAYRKHFALVRALSSGDVERAVHAAREHASSGAMAAKNPGRR